MPIAARCFRRVGGSRLVLLGLPAALAAALAVPAWTATRADGAPAVSGPLSLAAPQTGCAGGASCVFDYRLDPASTTDPADAWHAYWATTQKAPPARPGWCTTQVIAALAWGAAARPGPLASRTYPAVGTTAVGPSTAASLEVDAAGRATTPGRLTQQPHWPQGILTTTLRHGQLAVDWEGSTSRAMSLTMAAEISNPGDSSPSLQGFYYNEIGVPCADLAPPGTTFLSRLQPASISFGQIAWLELRVPSTGERVSPDGSILGRDGKATITISGGPYGGASLTETSMFPGRTSIALKSGAHGYLPGHYTITVTLTGPNRTQHYNLRMTVR